MIGQDRLVAITPEGDVVTIWEDGDRDLKAAALAAPDDSGVSTVLGAKPGDGLAPRMASVTFGGPDLRTVYVGSLGGTALPTFRSPVPGARGPAAALGLSARRPHRTSGRPHVSDRTGAAPGALPRRPRRSAGQGRRPATAASRGWRRARRGALRPGVLPAPSASSARGRRDLAGVSHPRGQPMHSEESSKGAEVGRAEQALPGGAVTRWLMGSRADQDRFRDMLSRTRGGRSFAPPWVAIVVVSSYWYGIWPLVSLAVAIALLALLDTGTGRRPELGGAADFAVLEAQLAVLVWLTGGAVSPLLPLMLVPVTTLAACFRRPVLMALTCMSGLLAVLASLGSALLPQPPASPSALHTVVYLTTLLSLVMGVQHQAAADVSTRDGATLDPMTGALNRASLAARFAEGLASSASTGAAFSVVMCDIDRFKQVNDVYGHARGDLVLQQFAERLHAVLRDSDLLYRIGGEEFLVLLPAHHTVEAAAVAERLREAVAASPVGGLAITMSAGVSSSHASAATMTDVLAAADAALYEAKTDGRNRVRVAAGPNAVVAAALQ